MDGVPGVNASSSVEEENILQGEKAVSSGLNQTRVGSGFEVLNYMDLSSEVIKEDMDELINASLSGIGSLKISPEVLNKTQLQEVELVFNETCSKYKVDLEEMLEKSDLDDKRWFSNIDLSSQEKLKEYLTKQVKKNTDAGSSGKKLLSGVPLNYVIGMDFNKWYPLLDSINVFAISLLNEHSTKKQGPRLGRRTLQTLVERINRILFVSSMITSSSYCKQIAWRLVMGGSRHLSILNGLSRKLLKKSQSSTLLLKRRNEPAIREYNAIVSKGQDLNSNVKGLLDVVIKARSDKLKSLVLLEHVSKDLQALKTHYLRLWEERNQWIASNKKMVKALTDWLQVSVGLVYRVVLGLSKSVLAYNIRNLSDLVYTIRESGGDLDKVKAEVEKSLDVLGHALKALRTGVVSMRHEEDSDMFRQAVEKLENHFMWLRKGYLEAWRDVLNMAKKSDPRAQLEEFLSSSGDLVSQLWGSDLKSPFKFDKDLETHNTKVAGLFKRISEFLRSESLLKHLEMQNSILKLRHYNEMLFPDLGLQIELVEREKDKFSTTGIIDWEVMGYILSHTFMNESVERCRSGNMGFLNPPTLRLGVSSGIMTRTSIWEEESQLISGEEELGQLSVDFLVAKKSKSLVRRNFFPQDSSSSSGLGEERVSRKESLEKLLVLKEKLMELSLNLQKELEAVNEEDLGLDSITTKPLLDKVQRLEKHIQTLDLAISNMEDSDQDDLNLLLGISQSFLTGQGVQSSTVESKARQISTKRLTSEVSRLKRELAGVKASLDKNMQLVKRISKFSSEISTLDESLELMEKYLSQLQARIDLFCGRIDRGGGPRTSRALTILKYTVRRKKPDTECEALILEFSRERESISAFLNSASELVAEHHAEIRSCKELEGISSKLSEVVTEFQKAKKELQILQNAYLDKSLEQGTKILEKSLQKLSQDSKKVVEEIKCYSEINLTPELVALYIKDIKRKMFKLKNTIERELNAYIFERQK